MFHHVLPLFQLTVGMERRESDGELYSSADVSRAERGRGGVSVLLAFVTFSSLLWSWMVRQFLIDVDWRPRNSFAMGLLSDWDDWMDLAADWMLVVDSMGPVSVVDSMGLVSVVDSMDQVDRGRHCHRHLHFHCHFHCRCHFAHFHFHCHVHCLPDLSTLVSLENQNCSRWINCSCYLKHPLVLVVEPVALMPQKIFLLPVFSAFSICLWSYA